MLNLLTAWPNWHGCKRANHANRTLKMRDQQHSSHAAFVWLASIAALLVALTVATPSAFRAFGDNAYIVLAVGAGFLALLAVQPAQRAPRRRTLWLIFGVAIALRLFLLFVEPLLSTDIYRYIWDGKVQANGINPYRYVPADAALAALRDSAIYPHINRIDSAVTIYPPVAQLFFLIVTRLGESVVVMKASLLACEAVTVAIVVALLRKLGKPVTLSVGYLWHPLPLWEIANNGHIDALMTALMMTGIWFAVAGRGVIAALFVGLSGLAKPISFVSLPALWRLWDVKAPALVLAAIALCYVPYLSVGWGVLGFLTNGYLNEESYIRGEQIWPLAMWRNLVGPSAFDYQVYLGLAVLVVGGLAVRSLSRDTPRPDVLLDNIKWLLMAFLLLLSANYPWYFLALVPFVALSGGAPVWAATVGAVLLHDELQWDYFIPLLDRKSVLYGAVIAAFVFAWWKSRRSQPPTGGDRRDRVPQPSSGILASEVKQAAQ